MNSKSLIAIAMMGIFVGAGSAQAGGSAVKHKSSVRTPATASDLKLDRTLSAPDYNAADRPAIGASATAGASGEIGFDSSMTTSTGTEYWRMDESPADASAAASGAGNGGLWMGGESE